LDTTIGIQNKFLKYTNENASQDEEFLRNLAKFLKEDMISKFLSDVSKDLLGLQKQVKELQADDPVQIGTQNNVVFAGSTSELMKLLGKKDDNIIDQ
jgi:hypothetical protein